MAEVEWTRKGLRDLQAIIDFVAQDSPTRAAKLAQRLLAAPDHLTHSPRMGRRVPEIGQDHVRELVTVRPYRIIYVIHEDTCNITAVMHSSRDLRNALRPGELEDI